MKTIISSGFVKDNLKTAILQVITELNACLIRFNAKALQSTIKMYTDVVFSKHG